MNNKNLEQHINILAWLHIVSHAFFLFLAVALWALLTGIGVVSGEAEAAGVLSIVGLFIGVIMGVMALPGIVAGYGLLKRTNWGRVLAIIVGALNLMNFPLGTALGAYTLYILLPEPAGDSFGDLKTA